MRNRYEINFIPTFTGASPFAYQNADMLARRLAQDNQTKIPTQTQTLAAIQQRHDQEIHDHEERHDQEIEAMRRNHLQQIMGTLQIDIRELVDRIQAEKQAKRKRHQEEDQQLLERQEQEIVDFIKVTLQKKSLTLSKEKY